MTQIQPFTFPTTGQSVRTLLVDGEPRFVAADVTAALDLGNPRSSLALLDDDEKGVHTMDTPGGPQQMVVVTEAGLYSLILRSRKPEAKAFKRWITHEVLPTIRRTGSYGAPVMPTLPEALRGWAAEVEAREEAEGRAEIAEHRLHEISPAANSWSALAGANGDYSLRAAGQILSRDPLITLGQNQLMTYLREIAWVDRHGEPYQQHVKAGRLVRRPTSYDHPHTGEPRLSFQVRVTVKGLGELHKRLGGFGDVANVVAA